MNTLTVIERENKRVMTTAVLADEYGTTEKLFQTISTTTKFDMKKANIIFV